MTVPRGTWPRPGTWRRRRFEFQGRAAGRYYWHAAITGDSRVLEISCPVDWFWSAPTPRPERAIQRRLVHLSGGCDDH